jgi:hypothetical protein
VETLILGHKLNVTLNIQPFQKDYDDSVFIYFLFHLLSHLPPLFFSSLSPFPATFDTVLHVFFCLTCFALSASARVFPL